MASGKIEWSLGLDASGFHKAVNGAQSAIKGAFKDMLGPIAEVTAAVGSVAAVMHGMKGSLELGAEMQDLSARTGIAVQDLVMLRKSFKDAGVDAEKLGPAVNKMQKALAEAASGGAGRSLFAGLGLDAQKLASSAPGQAFEQIGSAINKLGNPTERAAAAMQIFGRSGGELLAVFQSPAFQNAGTISNTARILGENAASFKSANEALAHVGAKLSGFFTGLASSFVPALHGVVEEFEKIDLSGSGETFGNVLGNAVTNFGDEWKKIVEFIGQSFDIIFSPEGLKVLGAEFLIIASKFGDAMLRALKTPLDYLQAGMQYTVESMGSKMVTGKFGQAIRGAIAYSHGGLPELGLYAATGTSPILSQLQNLIGGGKASSFKEIFDQIQKEGNGVQQAINGNAQNRQDLEEGMGLSGRLKALGEKFSAALKPVITATEATKKANEAGRAAADKEAGGAGSVTPFDPSELGMGKASIVADSFAKVGGGGYSVFLGLGDIQRQQLAAQQQANGYLAKIAGAFGAVPQVAHASP